MIVTLPAFDLASLPQTGVVHMITGQWPKASESLVSSLLTHLAFGYHDVVLMTGYLVADRFGNIGNLITLWSRHAPHKEWFYELVARQKTKMRRAERRSVLMIFDVGFVEAEMLTSAAMKELHASARHLNMLVVLFMRSSAGVPVYLRVNADYVIFHTVLEVPRAFEESVMKIRRRYFHFQYEDDQFLSLLARLPEQTILVYSMGEKQAFYLDDHPRPWRAAGHFALFVYLAASYLIPARTGSEKQQRFHKIAAKLPFDLHMVLACRMAGLGGDLIGSKHRNKMLDRLQLLCK